MLQVMQAGGYMQHSDITQGLMQSWIGYLDAKPKTVATYTRAIKQFWVYMQANNIKNPQREDVLAYKEALIAQGKAAATVQGYIVAVRLFFAWLAEQGIYPNIAEHIKGMKTPQYFNKDYLTTRQAKALLASCNQDTEAGARDYAMIALMVTTGLRTIEIERADIEDIRTIGDSTALFIQGKGQDAKSEYVKLSPTVEDAIRHYLTFRKGTTGALFTSNAHRNAGQRMTTRSISRIVKEHLQAVGLNSSKLTAHSLRHTAAHLMINAGEGLRNVQQVLRHSNINTTMIYLRQKSREDNNAELKAANAVFGMGE